MDWDQEQRQVTISAVWAEVKGAALVTVVDG